jgi:predicted GIY-YIG superfamily endonuclease
LGFTSQAMDCVWKYQENYTDKSQAMEREKEIKRWKRESKF